MTDKAPAPTTSDLPDTAATSAPEAPGTGPREKPTREGDGLNPTRYGDWEMNGHCIDF